MALTCFVHSLDRFRLKTTRAETIISSSRQVERLRLLFGLWILVLTNLVLRFRRLASRASSRAS